MLYPPYLATFHPLHAYLVPICFFAAWVVLLLFLANVWALSGDTVIYASRMHQIPCANCRFFTENYQLKCTIHPIEALTEEAINCPDYQSNNYTFSFNSSSTHTLSDINQATLENPKIEQVFSDI